MSKKKPGWKLLAVFSDTHAGSMLAACPPRVRLDDGGNYEPSKAQRWLWDCWQRYWQRVKQVRDQHQAWLGCLANGDLVDGAHHQTTQILSGNLEAQSYVLGELLAFPKALTPDAWYVVRGTEAHVGASGQSEEAAARGLNAVKDPETHTWSAWRHRIVLNGVRIDAQHHGRVGTRPWTRASGIGNLAFQIWVEHTENGELPPHLAVRSHRHVFSDSGDIYQTRVIQTAAFQLKTSYAHKVAAESIASIGAHLILVSPEGQYTVEHMLFKPSLPAPHTP